MTDQPPPDDESLKHLEKARSGDREAFERAIGRLARWAEESVPPLRRDVDAEAIATDAIVAILAICKKQDRVAPEVIAHIRQVARSRIRDAVRRHRYGSPEDRLIQHSWWRMKRAVRRLTLDTRTLQTA